jgi:hypothetical protein
MPHPPDNFLLQACRTLFGQNFTLSSEFLAELKPSGARVAYRNQVKEHHPDRFSNAPLHVRQRQTERFREIHQAYDFLKNFLEGRRSPNLQPAPSPRPRQKPPTATRTDAPSRQRAARPCAAARPAQIPAIPLEYGMYAYYSGKITYQDLIRALTWQRRQRPNLGTIARQWGWLSEAQVQNILRHRGHSRRFGRKAVELTYLQPCQVRALLIQQRSRQQKLGRFFVENKLISQFDADQLAGKLARHNARLRDQGY